MDEKLKETFTKTWNHLAKRPGMYFSNEVPAVSNFLEGFKLAFLVFNATPDFHEIFQQVVLSRGWENSAQGVWRQMQDQGLDEDTIIQELLTIYDLVFNTIIAKPGLETVEHKINERA